MFPKTQEKTLLHGKDNICQQVVEPYHSGASKLWCHPTSGRQAIVKPPLEVTVYAKVWDFSGWTNLWNLWNPVKPLPLNHIYRSMFLNLERFKKHLKT